MRTAKLGMLGLVLVVRAVSGCAINQGESAFDAGPSDEASVTDDSGTKPDAGAPSSDDAGHDATVGSGDDGGDGGGDTSVPPRMDAGDGSVSDEDAGDGAAREADAGDASTHETDAGDAADASDASPSAVDAGDASSGVDAGDASSTVDASDAAAGDEDAGDASVAVDDAGDAATGTDAGDAALACTSCGFAVSFLGNTAAFVSAGGASVGLQGGTVPDGATVSITTQTYPQGAVTAGNAHVIYATDSNFTTQVDAPMHYDHAAGNNDQWYVVLPAQPANTTVYWYVRANGCDCTTVLYDNPGGLSSYTYTEL